MVTRCGKAFIFAFMSFDQFQGWQTSTEMSRCHRILKATTQHLLFVVCGLTDLYRVPFGSDTHTYSKRELEQELQVIAHTKRCLLF